MVTFLSIASGSNGNCYYLGTPGFGVLIDVGVCHRSIKEALAAQGIGMDSLQMVLLTHDHFDHVRFLDTFIRKKSVPVVTSPRIKQGLLAHNKFAGLAPYLRTFAPGTWFDWPPLRIKSFVLPHDASQTLGFYILWEETRFALITDTGSLTPTALHYASQADTLVLESNFDEQMLREGPYPQVLKDRILSPDTGHLSNSQCAQALGQLWHPQLKHLFLCHLSEHNNTPELAYASARHALDSLPPQARSLEPVCLPRQSPSALYPLS